MCKSDALFKLSPKPRACKGSKCKWFIVFRGKTFSACLYLPSVINGVPMSSEPLLGSLAVREP